MQYVKYGNTGLTVSRLCWGAMNFYEREGEEGGIRMVHEALDAGINFFDTADAYGHGRSEQVLGKALKERRHRVVLATKAWVPMDKQDKNARGCSRYHLTRAVDASLGRLDTDHIDLYQLHHPDRNTPVEETLATLDHLVKHGKIRYVGVSNHYAWQMAHMLGVSALHHWEPLASVQSHYNLFNRAIETEIQWFCRRFNIAVITYGPLSGGLLSGKVHRGQALAPDTRIGKQGLERSAEAAPGISAEQHRERIFTLLESAGAIAAKYAIGLNQLAVKWVLSKEWITCPILGGSRAEHFSAMYGLFDLSIDPADLARLDELSAPFQYVPFTNQPVAQGAARQENWW